LQATTARCCPWKAKRIAQRFAIDWLKLGADGRSFDRDRSLNKNFHAYGAETLAVADATVIATKDGIPENVPSPHSPGSSDDA